MSVSRGIQANDEIPASDEEATSYWTRNRGRTTSPTLLMLGDRILAAVREDRNRLREVLDANELSAWLVTRTAGVLNDLAAALAETWGAKYQRLDTAFAVGGRLSELPPPASGPPRMRNRDEQTPHDDLEGH